MKTLKFNIVYKSDIFIFVNYRVIEIKAQKQKLRKNNIIFILRAVRKYVFKIMRKCGST